MNSLADVFEWANTMALYRYTIPQVLKVTKPEYESILSDAQKVMLFVDKEPQYGSFYVTTYCGRVRITYE